MHSPRVHPMHDSGITEKKVMISDLLRSAKNLQKKWGTAAALILVMLGCTLFTMREAALWKNPYVASDSLNGAHAEKGHRKWKMAFFDFVCSRR